jgi:hypothetical protein
MGLEMVADIRYPLLDTRQGVRMAIFPPKPSGYLGSPRDTYGQWPAGRVSFQSTRYMYLSRKVFLPVGKVHLPCQLEGFPSSLHVHCRLEGNPSSQQVTSTLPAGKVSFQPVRHVSRWLEGSPSSQLEGNLSSRPLGRYPKIPASGCGWHFPRKKQPDIWMRQGHLYMG